MEQSRYAKIRQVVRDIMAYLEENGWNSTLHLITEIQQRNDDVSKSVLQELESAISSCKNGDYIYYYARDVKGANLNSLLYGLESLLEDMIEFYNLNKKEYDRWERHKREIEKWIEKRKKPLTDGDILGSLDEI